MSVGDTTQLVDGLLSRRRALGSSPTTTQTKCGGAACASSTREGSKVKLTSECTKHSSHPGGIRDPVSKQKRGF